MYSPIVWLLRSACIRLHTFLPNDVKISFMGASHYKIIRIGAPSEPLQVCKAKRCCSAAAMLSESSGAVEDFKYRRHSVYGLDLLQPCVCWLRLVSSYCLVCLYHLGLKGAILFSSGCTLKL